MSAPLDPAQLLGERAVKRQITGMQPCHVELFGVSCNELGFDLIK